MSDAIDRLRRDPAVAAALDALGSLPGADLRSALLALAAERAAAGSPADLMRQYGDDRFCARGGIDALGLARAVASAHEAVAGDFESVVLSPLVPLGTSSIVGPVPQNNVVSTMRLSEVGADPTNALALEAAVRRRANRSEQVRLAGVQRVVRAQHFAGPRSFAHFSLFGLVSAARDRGDRAFEVSELVRHCRAAAAVIRSIDADAVVTAKVSDHSKRLDEARAVADQLTSSFDAVSLDTDRIHGRGYYDHLCVKVFKIVDGAEVEVGDGGSVPWTQTLLGDRKERLVISGLSLDRIVM